MRSIRIPDRIWLPFKAAAGSDHTDIHRTLLAWYGGDPGAKLPKRPAVIYSFRVAGTTDWQGHREARPVPKYKTGTITPETGDYAGQTLEVRYAPLPDDTPPTMRAYTTVGTNDRVYPTAAVHELLFGTGQ
jgi:hypothetical protein